MSDVPELLALQVMFVPMQQPLLGMKGQAATQAAALTAWSQEDHSSGSSQVCPCMAVMLGICGVPDNKA